jgi:catalase
MLPLLAVTALGQALGVVTPPGFELPLREDLGERAIENEDAVLADTVVVLTDIVQRKWDEQDRALRDVHAKGICVNAQFVVHDAPPALRHGVFAQDKTYDAIVRFSSSELVPEQDDWEPSFRGFAIKIYGVEGPALVDLGDGEKNTQDFLFNNWSTFPMRDAQAYHDAMEVRRDGALRALTFAPTHLYAIPALAAPKRIASPLRARYYSQSVIQVGDVATKMTVRPCKVRRASLPREHGPNYLRDAAKEELARADACFDVYVQTRTSENADATPVEDHTVEWSEARAPLERVARIVIPRQDFDTPAMHARCEKLELSPWHTVAAHRPLGSLNRARLTVYRALAEFRRTHHAEKVAAR